LLAYSIVDPSSSLLLLVLINAAEEIRAFVDVDVPDRWWANITVLMRYGNFIERFSVIFSVVRERAN
jgi:hypothetical protein